MTIFAYTKPAEAPYVDGDTVTSAAMDALVNIVKQIADAGLQTAAEVSSAIPVDVTGHTLATSEPWWDESTGKVRLRPRSPANPGTRFYDARESGAVADGQVVTRPVCTTGSAVVTFGAAHGLTAGDVGKTAWVADSGSNGTLRTVASVDSTTQVTLSGTAGKTLAGSVASYLVVGTPAQAGIASTLTAAGALVASSLDVTAGVNLPQGPNSGTTVFVGGGTGITVLTGPLTVPPGVRWAQDGVILYNGAGTVLTFGNNTSFERVTIDSGTASAVTIGSSTSGQAHVMGGRLEAWGRNATAGVGVLMQGLDFRIGEVWTKGYATSVKCVSGTDCGIGHLFAIGAGVALALSAAAQFTAKVFSDSCSSSVRLWGGCDNVSLDIQAFMTSSSTTGTTKVVEFAIKDDGTTTGSALTLNNDIRLNVQARDLGAPVVTLAQCQNVRVRGFLAPRVSAGATVASTRGMMTGVAYGAGVGDGIDVELGFPTFAQTVDASAGGGPAYALSSGIPVGTYVAKFDGKIATWAGTSGRITGGTATAPVFAAFGDPVPGDANLPLTSAAAARPTRPGIMYWHTPTQPTNALAGDVWRKVP